MSSEPSATPTVVEAPPTRTGPVLSEDWLATIIGLLILALVIARVITKGMVP